MKFRKSAFSFVSVVLGAALWAGCSSGGDGVDDGSDQAATAGCKVVSAQTGKVLSADELSKLGDPIAQRVLLNGCPQKLDGIIDSLSKAKDCKQSQLTTRLVSERSLLLDKADRYRGVMSQDCQGQSDHEVFVSIFGLSPAQANLPQDGIEVIGHDKSSGVFNFYVNENGWKFMGSSKDAISSGYDCTDRGDCEPKAASKARCWACHEGGGLNMKEINSPWVNWSNTPIHSDEAFKKFKALGTEQDGINMETRAEDANTDWNKTRIKILKEKGVDELLRPLFCTLTINLQATGAAGNVSFIPGEFFVTTPPGSITSASFIGFQGNGVSIDQKAYEDAIDKNLQKFINSDDGSPLQAHGKAVTESPSGFIFPKKGEIDQRYIGELVNQKLIDQDFVLDVLHVDFTRPVFSPIRCGLVDSAPKLSGADITADKVREGFKKSLASDSSDGAKQLLKNLGDTGDATAHQNDVNAFFTACGTRKKDEMVADILQYNAHLKFAAKAHRTKTPDGVNGIIEFSETFPVDKLKDSDAAFDPKDCTLK